jgi:hypothetical protein
MGDWMGQETTSSLCLGCGTSAGFTGFFCLADLACLGPVVTFGADFTFRPFVLVVATFVRAKAFSISKNTAAVERLLLKFEVT